MRLVVLARRERRSAVPVTAKVSAKMARVNTTDAGEGGGPGFPASQARELADTAAAIMAAQEQR